MVPVFDRLRSAVRRTPGDARSALLSPSNTRRPNTSEIGDSSVSYTSGTGKVRRLLDTEYLWELRSYNAFRTYDKMRFSDPKIAGLRFAQNLPLLRASATVEPADAKDTDAVEKADFIQRVLIDEFPWRAFVADTTLAADFGFAAFEVVWRIEGDEVHCRLALRPASSINAEDIYIIDGKVDHVVQRPRGGGEFTIPGDRLLWFCQSKEGDDFRGRSILRPMYKPWKLKQEVEVQLAVLIGKMGGVPVFTEHGTTPPAVQAMLDQAGASFGIAAGAYVRKPEDVDLELLASNAKVGEVLEAIKYWDTQLTGVCQAQILDLGVSQVGSRALGTTMGDMFADSIQAQASYREDVLNAKDGLIHQLINYNFGDDSNLPKLRFGNVQKSDIKAIAQALLWLHQAGMNLDEETWDWVRAEMNLPATDTSQEVVPAAVPGTSPAVAPAPEGSQTAPKAPAATSPDAGVPSGGGAQASEAPHTYEKSLTFAERRPPRGVEVYLNLAELTARFDDAKTAVRTATQDTRNALTAELAKRAVAAQAKGELAKFVAGAPPMVDKLKAEVLAVLTDFYVAGKQQVTDELQRQRDGKPWSADAVGSRVAAAERKPVAPKAVPVKDAINQQAEMAARSIAGATQNAAATNAARITAGVPIAAAVMEQVVIRESDSAALRFSGTVSDMMQVGRADEAQAQAQEIEDAVYSAMLDDSTCDACEQMDGEETTDLALAEEWAPNADCEGGDRCRCLVVYEIAQQGAGA